MDTQQKATQLDTQDACTVVDLTIKNNARHKRGHVQIAGNITMSTPTPAPTSGSETNITTIIFNCNSIYKKVEEIKDMLSNTKPDLLCLTETWINKSEPKFCGYSSEWKHRLQKTGGGIGILIREDIPYQNLQLDPYKDGILEIQAIKTSTTRFENIKIGIQHIGITQIKTSVYKKSCIIWHKQMNQL